MEKFKNQTNGFNYVYEKELEPGESVIIEMPPVSPNKRGINDIGWLADDDISLYATLSKKSQIDELKWQPILEDDEINKTVSALKAVNNGRSSSYLIIKVIFC